MRETHKGSCLCGTVQFQIQATFKKFYFCHCSYCRKGSSSVHGSNLFSFDADFACTSGEDSIKSYNVTSTQHRRSFCEECGSPVPTHDRENNFLVVPAGSLDTPVDTQPTAHIFMASKASWDDHLEDVTKFDKFPE
ncbi:GFA family protein [Pseudovibrio sp. Ad37]|uniref:GFA family protein n=1 Tax=Pseudovibrio sp. Ad37 TaxID=989422 RepID=UPI0007AE9301|nr:GFA family protein [Pseudovibrio sp. Ad37]KZL26387.1 Glutathione-dependent formaldehyde-activating enzyme [Pseudovibrio sp. Ad37]